MSESTKTVLSFVMGAIGLGLIGMPTRALIGADPFAPIGFALSAIIGGFIGMSIAILISRNRKRLEDQVEARTAALLEANEKLRLEMEERNQTEEQLRQANKLEAMGRLAGGVAHDINNLLTAIMTVASTIDIELKAGSKEISPEEIKDIIDACKRGRELTLSLLGFARKREYEKKPMLVTTAMEEIDKLLVRVIPKTITVETRFSPDLAQIKGDPGQIKNALMNLCINAVDAMEGKGTLEIIAKNVVLSEQFHGAEPGEYVRLEFRDTGCGMEDEIIERAFDPFFTTKPEGRGTGLGLSRVYGIIQDHYGSVWIDSRLGQGTAITVLFPALGPTERDPSIQASLPPYAVPSQTTILMVDDEALVRKSVSRLLGQLGYNVILASNGAEGVAVFQKEKNDISCVILDMIMPVMDGEEAFHKIREIEPRIPILICSGYSNEDNAKKLLTERSVGFVQKPFSPGALSAELTTLVAHKTNGDRGAYM
ncbi:MAG: response regulator [Deltaproteobacteria bacterium]|nr:response regulator [Deltaproteobacteria bacterium]